MVKISEKSFQLLIEHNPEIQRGIVEAIFASSTVKNYTFARETEYINRITSDFSIIDESKKKIVSILECKKKGINVTDYVRGIGQLFQYEYYTKNDIRPKRYSEYSFENIEKFRNALVLPEGFLSSAEYNISLFNYPKSMIFVEINTRNHNVRVINRKELEKIGSGNRSNIKIISPYYIRDNRVFEYYIALQYINYWHAIHPESILNRKKAEEDLRKVNTINNGNWRNAFITLSSLGFIDTKNRLTTSGRKMVSYTLFEFTFEMYNGYLKPYIDYIMKFFNRNPSYLNKSNKDIAKLMREIEGKDLLFLTQSDGRYISSWLNIIRDDYGCLMFESRKNNREYVYSIYELNRETIIQKLSQATIGNIYLKKYNELVRNNFRGLN